MLHKILRKTGNMEMAIFAITMFIFSCTGTTLGQGHVSMMVTVISDVDSTDIIVYGGDPSIPNVTTDETWYSLMYYSTVSSIASDFRKRNVFILERYPGDVVKLSNVTAMLDNAIVTDFHHGITDGVSQIAVDWIHGNVYWTDGGFSWIVMQPSRTSDKTMYRVILQDLQQPLGIAVDPIEGYIFWSEIGNNPCIRRASLSGENATVLVYKGLIEPAGITLDFTARRIYWVDGGKATIDSMDYDGNDRDTLYYLTNATLTSVFLYKDAVLVADSRNNRLVSIDKVTHKIIRTWSDLPGSPTGITVFGELSQPDYEDVCADSSCEQICVKTFSGAKCLCRNRYHIQSDGNMCEEDSTLLGQEIVYAVNDSIQYMDIRSVITDRVYPWYFLFSDIGTVNGMEIDMVNNELFYYKDDIIYRRTFIDTSDQILAKSKGTIGGIVFDWVKNNLYWTEQESGRIMVVSITTGASLAVLNTLLPISITADPYESVLFWISNIASPKIMSAQMDGSNIRDLAIGTTLSSPTDLTIDLKSDRIYWLNSEEIKSMKTDGTDIRNEMSVLWAANRIAIFRDYVVWTDDYSLNSFRMSDNNTYWNYIFDVTALVIFDSDLQRTDKGTCWKNNGGCDHVCLPIEDHHACRCEFGYTLQTDGVTCGSDLIKNNYFLLSDSTHQEIYQVSLSNGDVRALDIDDIGKVTGITYSEEKQKLYWADANVGIKSATFDSRIATLILRLPYSSVKRLAIDHETSNIYYTVSNEDTNTGYIGVLDEEANTHRELISTLVQPLAIVLRPSKGIMYWTDIGTGKIFESNMDGTNSQGVVANLGWPTGLALDDTGNKLYYVDGKSDIIGVLDLLGKNRDLITTDVDAHLRDLYLDGGYLYYTGFNRFYVTRLNLDNLSDTTRLAPNAEFGRLETVYVHSEEQQTETETEENRKSTSDSMSTETLTYILCGVGIPVILVAGAVIIVCVVSKKRKQSSSNYIDHHNPVFTLNPAKSRSVASTMDYDNNDDSVEGGYLSLNEMQMNRGAGDKANRRECNQQLKMDRDSGEFKSTGNDYLDLTKYDYDYVEPITNM